MGDQPIRVGLEWDKGLSFMARAGGHEIRLDGEHRDGNSPMELLLEALAGCMAIDLVHILGRMRAEIRSLRVQVEGVRADAHPRRYMTVSLHFDIEGDGLREADVERAIKLSRETYCSVLASLRPDTDVKITCSVAKQTL
jgi:putative redox protein